MRDAQVEPRSRGRRSAKTDRLDARWLARLLAKEMLPQSWIPPAQIQKLRDRIHGESQSLRRRLKRLIRLDHRVDRNVVCVSGLTLPVVLRVRPRRQNEQQSCVGMRAHRVTLARIEGDDSPSTAFHDLPGQLDSH
jgi:hypothetical protein